MGKRVAVIQSSYIPWKGYFDIINDVDEFIFYDDVQFTRQDWRSRNRIKTSNGPLWLSIPTGSALDRRICDVRLEDSRWQAKHWKSILQNYSRTAHFARYRDFFEAVYLGRTWESLSELNQFLTREISQRFLGIRVKFDDSRRHDAQGQRLDRLIDLLAKAGATTYVSGPSARDYIDEAAFAAAGIALQFKDYGGYPEYPQTHPPFRHDISVIDLLFNVGEAAPDFIWNWRQRCE